jgi:hypothetical protein
MTAQTAAKFSIIKDRIFNADIDVANILSVASGDLLLESGVMCSLADGGRNDALITTPQEANLHLVLAQLLSTSP